VNGESKPGFFQRWGKVHRDRKAASKKFNAEYQDRLNDLSRIRSARDYDHLDAFYAANPERAAELHPTGTIDDADVRWTINFLPLTGEVIAVADRWLDDSHQEPVPDDVFVLGKTGSEEGAHAAILRSTNLESLRDALY
jgi:hypothetical protein